MGVVRIAVHGTVFVALTALTQLGGLVWLGSRLFRRPILAFVVIYAGVWGGVQVVAPWFGRVPMPCQGEVLREQSVLYCTLMRNFVVPEVKAVAEDAAARVASDHPGTVTLALDGGFPFLVGFPLLPHLSHDDGEKLDLAYFYAGPGRLLAISRSKRWRPRRPARRSGRPCAGDWTGPRGGWATPGWSLRGRRRWQGPCWRTPG